MRSVSHTFISFIVTIAYHFSQFLIHSRFPRLLNLQIVFQSEYFMLSWLSRMTLFPFFRIVMHSWFPFIYLLRYTRMERAALPLHAVTCPRLKYLLFGLRSPPRCTLPNISQFDCLSIMIKDQSFTRPNCHFERLRGSLHLERRWLDPCIGPENGRSFRKCKLLLNHMIIIKKVIDFNSLQSQHSVNFTLWYNELVYFTIKWSVSNL